jgi:hypothetical protein
VDDFIDENSIPKVDFMKIDVEGAEKLVLDGAKKLRMSDHRVTILFESSDHNQAAFGYSTKQLLSELSREGKEVFFLDELNRLRIAALDNKKLGNKIYNFVTLSR